MNLLRHIYQPGKELSLADGHTSLWRYRFATDHQKPFIHPLTTPSGVALTCFEPWDHQWHRGLWFSWQYINDVNYWEERNGVPAGVGEGKTEFVGPEEVSLTPEGARVVSRYRYLPPSGGPILEDAREVFFAMPENDRYSIDFSLAFTAKADIVIRRTPEDWGGYSGFSIRTARSMGGFQLLNSEGQKDADTQHAPARWVDLTGKADGGWGIVAGVTFMEHPHNPRTPNRWKTFGMDGFGYINPSLVMQEPLVLKKGEKLSLRYRALAHDGQLDVATLDAEFARFAQ